jgi:hypothetical protein
MRWKNLKKKGGPKKEVVEKKNDFGGNFKNP